MLRLQGLILLFMKTVTGQSVKVNQTLYTFWWRNKLHCSKNTKPESDESFKSNYQLIEIFLKNEDYVKLHFRDVITQLFQK